MSFRRTPCGACPGRLGTGGPWISDYERDGPRCLLEQIVERLLRAIRGTRRSAARWRTRLALDRRSRREQSAAVAFVLGRDPGRDAGVFRALPADARVERHTLNAAVEVDAALRARIELSDRQRQQISAAGTPKHFVRGHQVGGLGTPLVLKHASRRAFLRRLGRLRSTRPALARIVLIAPLPILAVAHGWDYIKTADRRQAWPRATFRVPISSETPRGTGPRSPATSACRGRGSDRWSE